MKAPFLVLISAKSESSLKAIDDCQKMKKKNFELSPNRLCGRDNFKNKSLAGVLEINRILKTSLVK